MTSQKPTTITSTVHIDGPVKNSNIIAGSHNVVKSSHVILPAAEAVDIRSEVSTLADTLSQLDSADQPKIQSAFADAQTELSKAEPEKDEVGKALERALGYAQKAAGFGSIIEKLKPNVINAAAWLGKNCDQMLALIGLSR